MKMTAGRRALDKIYKRRDRYEIPDWQRGEVWNPERQQELIDTILRGWKLPKFYLVRYDDDEFEVVDGQQRLKAIYEFFGNTLPLSESSSAEFGGPLYKDLKPRISDSFDDFEIEYDEIEDASEEELKNFFQRLQNGLPLTSSEKLNSVHSKLRDFCSNIVKRHGFFKTSVALANTRFAHFDVVSKVAALEIEGIDCGLRFDDVKRTFEEQRAFASSSAVAKRIVAACDLLLRAFPEKEVSLRNRTVLQSVLTLACRFVQTGRSNGLEKDIADFTRHFLAELTHQVELGQAATDIEFIRFQKSVNANVKAGPQIRHEILLRKAFVFSPKLADVFDPAVIASSGISGRIKELAAEISSQVGRLNSAYSSAHGDDLFKSTNKTVQSQRKIGTPIKTFSEYSALIGDLYFLFRESIGQRLGENLPISFVDVNALRTELQHDVDHGPEGKVRAKRKKSGEAFVKYSGASSPQLLDASRFVLVQANLLSALAADLTNLTVP